MNHPLRIRLRNTSDVHAARPHAGAILTACGKEGATVGPTADDPRTPDEYVTCAACQLALEPRET